MTFPWEQLPAVQPAAEPAPINAKIVAIQRDLAYMVTHTGVMVRCARQPALEMLVNTSRGQIMPRGTCKFADGTTIEFQDVGMPQVGAPQMTMSELMAHVWDVARKLGLELI